MAKNCNTSPFYLQGQSPTIQNQVAIIERFLKKQLPNYAVITISLNGVDVPKDEFGNVDLAIETIKGDKGDKGDPGEKGDKGDKGEPGIDGKDGVDGADGVSPHIDSTSGNWFIGNSDTGVHAQGEDGADGSDGSDGESAYEIWLEQGHTGTVDDFFDWLRGNKVTKFYNSIEELEIGEIGEYQGETNETFTRGYFYERGTGNTEIKVISENTVSPTYYVDVHPLNDKSKSVRLVNNINISNPLYHGGVSAQYTMSNGDNVEIFGFPSDNPYIKTTRLMPAIPPVSTSSWYAMPKAYNYTQNEWVDYEIEISGSGNWNWNVTIEGQNPSSFRGWGFEAYIYMMYYPYPEIGYVPCLIVGRFNGNYICPMPIDLPFTMQIDDLWFDNSIFLGEQLRLYNLINDSFTFKTFQYISSPSIQRIDVQPQSDNKQYWDEY